MFPAKFRKYVSTCGKFWQAQAKIIIGNLGSVAKFEHVDLFDVNWADLSMCGNLSEV
jgi:hypothetical protein